jgi:hypothetical protein
MTRLWCQVARWYRIRSGSQYPIAGQYLVGQKLLAYRPAVRLKRTMGANRPYHNSILLERYSAKWE